MGVGGKLHAPAALPPEMTLYLLYRRLGGPQDRFERMRKISPPPEFDPLTVQPVAVQCNNKSNFIIQNSMKVQGPV
jgi:hypothetical protein